MSETVSVDVKLPTGVTVAVSGDPAQGMVLTAAADGSTIKNAEALLSSALAAVGTAWQASIQ